MVDGETEIEIELPLLSFVDGVRLRCWNHVEAPAVAATPEGQGKCAACVRDGLLNRYHTIGTLVSIDVPPSVRCFFHLDTKAIARTGKYGMSGVPGVSGVSGGDYQLICASCFEAGARALYEELVIVKPENRRGDQDAWAMEAFTGAIPPIVPKPQDLSYMPSKYVTVRVSRDDGTTSMATAPPGYDPSQPLRLYPASATEKLFCAWHPQARAVIGSSAGLGFCEKCVNGAMLKRMWQEATVEEAKERMVEVIAEVVGARTAPPVIMLADLTCGLACSIHPAIGAFASYEDDFHGDPVWRCWPCVQFAIYQGTATLGTLVPQEYGYWCTRHSNERAIRREFVNDVGVCGDCLSRICRRLFDAMVEARASKRTIPKYMVIEIINGVLFGDDGRKERTIDDQIGIGRGRLRSIAALAKPANDTGTGFDSFNESMVPVGTTLTEQYEKDRLDDGVTFDDATNAEEMKAYDEAVRTKATNALGVSLDLGAVLANTVSNMKAELGRVTLPTPFGVGLNFPMPRPPLPPNPPPGVQVPSGYKYGGALRAAKPAYYMDGLDKPDDVVKAAIESFQQAMSAETQIPASMLMGESMQAEPPSEAQVVTPYADGLGADDDDDDD